MNTITVEVPTQIAKKYWKKIVNYNELLKSIEEGLWIDFEVKPKIEMKDFYNLVKNGDGWKMVKNRK